MLVLILLTKNLSLFVNNDVINKYTLKYLLNKVMNKETLSDLNKQQLG